MKRRASVLAAAAWALIVVAGCSSAPLPPPPPPPDAVTEYVVEPGDTLALRFERNPELNEDALVVRPDGMISPQLVPELQAAGLTPAALSEALQHSYATELAHPRVKVTVKSFTKQRVSIAGEVGTPGVQPYLDGLTLSQAIHHAGGFLKTANREQVVLIRRHRDGRVTGHAVDVEALEKEARPDGDVALQPLDQVFVPKTQIADVNVWVEQYIKNNIPINSLGIGLTPF